MNIVGEMRSYLGEDYAILKFSESRESFSIDIVSVPFAHRGQGIGAELITHILQLADIAGKSVHVAARPIGNYDEDKLQRLVVYYGRFGFEQIDRGISVSYMQRRPRPLPPGGAGAPQHTP
ncbi:MAG: hypothetical protein ACYCX3_00100 [Thermoleophilia bacterium]